MLALTFGLWAGVPVHAAAAAPEKPSGTLVPSPGSKLQALTDLLADPDIQAILNRQGSSQGEAPAPNAPTKTMAISLADRLQNLRGHLMALSGAVLTLPADAAMARTMVADALDKRGWVTATAFLIGFVALGFGAEQLFRATMRPAQRWLFGLTLATVDERVRAVFARLAFGLALLASFALGSVGAFLLFDWPIAIKEILLGYLIAFLLVRLFAVVGRILLAPSVPRFRVVPITTAAAAFLYVRWLLVAVLIGFFWQTISLFNRFGLSPLAGELLGDAAGLVLALLGLDILWRMPPASLKEVAETERTSLVTRNRPAFALVGTVVILALWGLWVAQAMQTFWLVAFAAALPLTTLVARRSVNHILRPPGVDVSSEDAQTVEVVVFERGIRSVLIVSAALLLGRILEVDFTSLTMEDTITNRVMRGALSIVIIGLVADFLWHVIKALIDRRLATSLTSAGDAVDAGHAARLQTLLPIISNMLRVVIIVLAGMMMLSSAGVQIGPLIASAGVVGVAIGFGAQTLVKDVISGIFYLFDDAFRIGEYIQSGTYKGTVESFSLRSVKLRHQRGALYTVPFGILGAVQNQSRDWVVDKILLNVAYGTDLDKVRKLIKRIGEGLAEDPDFAPDIIVPLKMQGVVQFGDFAVQIQTKMMTKPGDVQFLARRRALLLIDKSFRDNGIGFGLPVVHVAGGGETTAAVQQGLELVKARSG